MENVLTPLLNATTRAMPCDSKNMPPFGMRVPKPTESEHGRQVCKYVSQFSAPPDGGSRCVRMYWPMAAVAEWCCPQASERNMTGIGKNSRAMAGNIIANAQAEKDPGRQNVNLQKAIGCVEFPRDFFT